MSLDKLEKSPREIFHPEIQKNMLNRRSFSEVFPGSPKSTRKKEDARQTEFVRLGQALKLKTTVKGDTTANLATTSFCKKEMLQQKRGKVQCQSDSAVTIGLIKDEPGGRSTSPVKASVDIFIPEKIQ